MAVITRPIWIRDDTQAGAIRLVSEVDADAYGLAVTVNDTSDLATIDWSQFYDGTLVFDVMAQQLYSVVDGALEPASGAGPAGPPGPAGPAGPPGPPGEPGEVEGSIETTLPLTGGGELNVDLVLGVNDFTAVTRGTVPASGGGSAFYLRADGTWGTNVVAKLTAPSASDFGLPALQFGLLWVDMSLHVMRVWDGARWHFLVGWVSSGFGIGAFGSMPFGREG